MGRPRAISRLVSVAFVLLFVIRVWQQKWISDDGYIYLTYVQNWVENGAGPVFNRGEYVEAYTSVAWFGLLSLLDVVRLDRLLTLPQLTLLISLACSTLAVAAWIPIERLAARRPDRPLLSLPLAYVAGTTAFNTFATSGLETPLLLIWLAMSVAVVWRPGASTTRSVLMGTLVVGVGPLVRPDLALPAAIVGVVVGWRFWAARADFDRPRRVLAAGVALVLGPGLLTVALRVGTYAQLLPNTVYAKTGSGYGFAQGWVYLVDTAVPYHLWVVALVGLAVVGVDAERVRRGVDGAAAQLRRRGILLGMATATTLAVMSEGGDFMHSRMLLTPWYLLLAVFAGVGTNIVDWARQRWPSAANGWVVAAAGAASIAIFFAQTTMRSQQVSTGELIDGDIADEAAFYASVDPNLHSFGGEAEDPWAKEGRDAAALAARLEQEIGFSTGTIGRRSFYGQRDHGQVYVFDVFGLTRPDVARMQMGPDWQLRVGHNRSSGFGLILDNPRVDFAPTWNAEYNKAFTVMVGTSPMVLINLDLIGPLREAGLIADDDVQRMMGFLEAELDRSTPDPDLVALVLLRYHADDPIRARALDRRAIAEHSKSITWLDEFEPTLELFRPDRCATGWWGCLELALRRQRAHGPISFERWEPPATATADHSDN